MVKQDVFSHDFPHVRFIWLTLMTLRHFINSAYWTFTALDVARLEVRFCSVSARVDQAPYHDLGNLDAFNTDGTLAI